MATHAYLLRSGAQVWNAWRKEFASVIPNLVNANLDGMDLAEANLAQADLSGANISSSNLSRAQLRGANMSRATMIGTDFTKADFSYSNLSQSVVTRADFTDGTFSMANLRQADLQHANLSRTSLWRADFRSANLSTAKLTGARCSEANFSGADLTFANLVGADLVEANMRAANLLSARLQTANLSRADLTGANLTNAVLQSATFVEANLSDAILSGCRVYGISAWQLRVSDKTNQRGLIITAPDEPDIIADDLEVAQFLYLMLHNDKIRRVIDTITSKVVLILGRFGERKEILDALRDELRKPEHGYVPVVFDFEKPSSQTTIETATLLARMARFVIADLTDARSVLQELHAVVTTSPTLAIQPLIEADEPLPAMFDFIKSYRSVCKVYRYSNLSQLLSRIGEEVVRSAEAKVLDLRRS